VIIGALRRLDVLVLAGPWLERRFLIVPVLSSAARMPLPSATSALAVSDRSFSAIV
jgi:hypothetical protein